MEIKGLNVYITTKAFAKIVEFTMQCEEEISGFGKVECVEDGFVINDSFILKQNVSGASTDIDTNELMKALMSKRNTKNWRLWWHSHVNMEAFWSATDDETVEKLVSSKPMISLVINKSRDYLCRIDWMSEGIHRFSVNDIKLQTIPEISAGITSYCKSQIKQKVKSQSSYSYDNYSNGINTGGRLSSMHDDYLNAWPEVKDDDVSTKSTRAGGIKNVTKFKY